MPTGCCARKAGPRPAAPATRPCCPFERTSLLVTRGAFRYIRHPMYTALILLAWGAFLKHVSASSVGLVAVATVALWATARRDEQECLAHFGAPYADYMRASKRFIPFVL